MNFDKKAKDWDKDSGKTERALAFAKEVNQFLDGKKLEDALEFGSGTGILSFIFREQFRHITLVDTSVGMIKVLNEKIRKNNIQHFRTIMADLETKPLNDKFDIIYTMMTLHHIRDLDNIFHIFATMLAEGGYLCIGDLEKENGSFHGHMPEFDGHHGFEKEKLERLLDLHGFEVLDFHDFYSIEKGTGEQRKSYPLFILIAHKRKNSP